MVNSGSFSSEGDRNGKASSFIQANTTSVNPQSPSPITASGAGPCKNEFTRTADSDLPSEVRAIEPTPTKTDFNNSTENCLLSVQKLNEDKTSLYCSVPLDKVQTILSTYKPFKIEGGGGDSKTKNTRKILCLYCDRTFVNVNLRQKHVERCHSTKQLRRVSSRRNQNNITSTPCIYCDKLTTTEHTLKELFEHLVFNHSNKYYGCLTCEERFLNSSHLNDHNASTHRVFPPQDDTHLLGIKEMRLEIENLEQKMTRSQLKPKTDDTITTKTGKRKYGQDASKSLSAKDQRNKKLLVKSSRIALKRSKRLQAKFVESQKQKRQRNERKAGKSDIMNTKLNQKPAKTSINPYPEFDSFFRVKKITDHSIDNLKISSLTFDDVFDKAFFNRIKFNIQENLVHHIDGKLFKNEESESRISNFEKISNAPQEIQHTNSENYGCELSLNAVTPAPSLLSSSQFGEDLESQIEYGSKPSKKKTSRSDEVHYKYFTRRKYQASILEHKENRDLSKLDMWTQYVVKNRQQKILDDQKSAKELSDYVACEEYKNKIRREELNRILDRRGPFEDLREEASKKAALEKLSPELDDQINEENSSEVRELLTDLVNRVYQVTQNISFPVPNSRPCSSSTSDTPEIPSYLNLRRSCTLPGDDEIDKSDKIALICSSQETENFELPTNSVRDKNEKVELTGEWARSRIFVCAACGIKLQNVKQLIEHKSVFHQHVWAQHYEFVGNQSELYRHLSIPSLGKVGVLEDTVQCKLWKRSDARSCSKCEKQCNSLGELHRHILECGGDWTWMLARKKYKYRPFGAKSRRKRRGLVKRIYTQKTEPTEKKIYKKTFDGPRPKPSDADTIQRMLANLPPKRATRKIVCLKDGIYTPRTNQQTKTAKIQTKLKCGKLIHRKLNENNSNNQESKTNNQKSGYRKSLRNLNKVLASRILDTNAALRIKRKFKALNNKHVIKPNDDADKMSDGFEDIDEELTDSERKSPSKSVKTPEISEVPVNDKESGKVKRISPRKDKSKNIVSTVAQKTVTTVADKMNIKRFFTVKKKSNSSHVSLKNSQKMTVVEGEPSSALPQNAEVADTKKIKKRETFSSLVRTLSLRAKKRNKDQAVEKNPSKKEQPEENTKKRKHTNKIAKIIKKRKVTAVSSSTEPALSGDFLDKQQKNESEPPEQIVIPVARSENVAEVAIAAPIVVNSHRDPGIVGTVFDMQTNNEKTLQAKGELNFDDLPPLLEPVVSVTRVPEIKIESVSPTPDLPVQKVKIRKPPKRLNDCIAMLTDKLNKSLGGSAPLNLVVENKEQNSAPNNSELSQKETETKKESYILKVPLIKDYFIQKKTDDLSIPDLTRDQLGTSEPDSLVQAPLLTYENNHQASEGTKTTENTSVAMVIEDPPPLDLEVLVKPGRGLETVEQLCVDKSSTETIEMVSVAMVTEEPPLLDLEVVQPNIDTVTDLVDNSKLSNVIIANSKKTHKRKIKCKRKSHRESDLVPVLLPSQTEPLINSEQNTIETNIDSVLQVTEISEPEKVPCDDIQKIPAICSYVQDEPLILESAYLIPNRTSESQEMIPSKTVENRELIPNKISESQEIIPSKMVEDLELSPNKTVENLDKHSDSEDEIPLSVLVKIKDAMEETENKVVENELCPENLAEAFKEKETSKQVVVCPQIEDKCAPVAKKNRKKSKRNFEQRATSIPLVVNNFIDNSNKDGAVIAVDSTMIVPEVDGNMPTTEAPNKDKVRKRSKRNVQQVTNIHDKSHLNDASCLGEFSALDCLDNNTDGAVVAVDSNIILAEVDDILTTEAPNDDKVRKRSKRNVQQVTNIPEKSGRLTDASCLDEFSALDCLDNHTDGAVVVVDSNIIIAEVNNIPTTEGPNRDKVGKRSKRNVQQVTNIPEESYSRNDGSCLDEFSALDCLDNNTDGAVVAVDLNIIPPEVDDILTTEAPNKDKVRKRSKRNVQQVTNIPDKSCRLNDTSCLDEFSALDCLDNHTDGAVVAVDSNLIIAEVNNIPTTEAPNKDRVRKRSRRNVQQVTNIPEESCSRNDGSCLDEFSALDCLDNNTDGVVAVDSNITITEVDNIPTTEAPNKYKVRKRSKRNVQQVTNIPEESRSLNDGSCLDAFSALVCLDNNTDGAVVAVDSNIIVAEVDDNPAAEAPNKDTAVDLKIDFALQGVGDILAGSVSSDNNKKNKKKSRSPAKKSKTKLNVNYVNQEALCKVVDHFLDNINKDGAVVAIDPNTVVAEVDDNQTIEAPTVDIVVDVKIDDFALQGVSDIADSMSSDNNKKSKKKFSCSAKKSKTKLNVNYVDQDVLCKVVDSFLDNINKDGADVIDTDIIVAEIDDNPTAEAPTVDGVVDVKIDDFALQGASDVFADSISNDNSCPNNKKNKKSSSSVKKSKTKLNVNVEQEALSKVVDNFLDNVNKDGADVIDTSIVVAEIDDNPTTEDPNKETTVDVKTDACSLQDASDSLADYMSNSSNNNKKRSNSKKKKKTKLNANEGDQDLFFDVVDNFVDNSDKDGAVIDPNVFAEGDDNPTTEAVDVKIYDSIESADDLLIDGVSSDSNRTTKKKPNSKKKKTKLNDVYDDIVKAAQDEIEMADTIPAKKRTKNDLEQNPDETLVNGEIKENNCDDNVQDNVRRRSNRSAKVKALESILDDALSELTESERNREIFKSVLINDNVIKTNRRKSKRSLDRSSRSDDENKNFDLIRENLCKVLLKEKRREVFNSVDDDDDNDETATVAHAHTAASSNASSDLQTDLICSVSIKPITSEPIESLDVTKSLDGGDVAETDSSPELRRSRRSSRKITSYNELTDPILDNLEADIARKKKETIKIFEQEAEKCDIVEKSINDKQAKKLNSNELFDLVKTTANDDDALSNSANTFLNNFEISNDFNDDNNFDNFDNILEKSIAAIEENLAEKSLPVLDENISQVELDDDSEIKEDARPKRTRSLKLKAKLLGQEIENKLSTVSSGATMDKASNGLEQSSEQSSNNADVTTIQTNKNKKKKGADAKPGYCDICNKSFSRTESLVKHKRTLTHISKLSEIEAREAEMKSKTGDQDDSRSDVIEITSDSSKNDINLFDMLQNIDKPDESRQSPSPFSINMDNSSLKLADIINDVLNKPVLNKDDNKQMFCELTTDPHPEFRRYKSLGERKSFEADNPQVQESTLSKDASVNSMDYFEPQLSKAAGTILEKQISLLQNMIENQSGMKYIDNISISSGQSVDMSIDSLKQDDSHIYSERTTHNLKSIVPEEGFIKPTQYEEISDDSNLKNYDDPKARKVLNRDEELFLECCSLLKSGSEVSSYSKKSISKVLNNLDLKPSEEPSWLENKTLPRKDFVNIDDYSDSTRIPTPLGDNFADDQSNSNTISSNWNTGKDDQQQDSSFENGSFVFKEIRNESEAAGRHDCEEDDGRVQFSQERFDDQITSKSLSDESSCSSRDADDDPHKKSEDLSDASTSDSRKMLTKGAMKIFEGLKVSIPTEDLNMTKVLNSGPQNAKSVVDEKSKIFTTSPKKQKSKLELGNKFLFKIKRKPLPKAFKRKKSDNKMSTKTHDIYDFEETQDNSDIFTKPDFRSFRCKNKEETKKIEAHGDSDNDSGDCANNSFEALSSSASSVSDTINKKPKAPQQNITKKKCMIMGRIFKNAIKSRVEDEIRDIPVIDHAELVEHFVLNCSDTAADNSKKPSMTEEEMNMAFDKLVNGGHEENTSELMKKPPTPTLNNKSQGKTILARKKSKSKNKKRSRADSDSTDDEFSLTSKKRNYRKNSKTEDNSINLEQELRECIGVASRKSQRKCTSGKQNVLVEYWSSDESMFEALLESQILTDTPKDDNGDVTSPPVTQNAPAVVEPPPPPPQQTVQVEEPKKIDKKRKLEKVRNKKPKEGEAEATEMAAIPLTTLNRRKRAAANPLYHWSSSSEDEACDLIEIKPLRDEIEDDEDRPIQHGWIVGDSPKKLVTMLAQAKGKKSDVDGVKEQGKKRNNAFS